MKKIVTLIVLMMMMVSSLANAARVKPEDVTPADINTWGISMMPKDSAEKEAEHWSLILENELGIYAYDMASMHYGTKDKNTVDKNIVNVNIKTVFTEKKLLENLNKKYASKLNNKEKVLYSIMNLDFNLSDKTYKNNNMKVFSNKNKEIDNMVGKNAFSLIPQKSFAEALYEICLKTANEEEASLAATK